MPKAIVTAHFYNSAGETSQFADGVKEPVGLQIQFPDEESPTQYTFGNVPSEIQSICMLHGFKDCLVQTYSNFTRDGKWNDARDAVTARYAAFLEGSFSRRVHGGAPKEEGLTIQAIANVQGFSLEDANKAVDAAVKKSGASRAAVMAHFRLNVPKIVKEYAKLQAARAATKTGGLELSLDDLTGDMDETESEAA